MAPSSTPSTSKGTKSKDGSKSGTKSGSKGAKSKGGTKDGKANTRAPSASKSGSKGTKSKGDGKDGAKRGSNSGSKGGSKDGTRSAKNDRKIDFNGFSKEGSRSISTRAPSAESSKVGSKSKSKHGLIDTTGRNIGATKAPSTSKGGKDAKSDKAETTSKPSLSPTSEFRNEFATTAPIARRKNSPSSSPSKGATLAPNLASDPKPSDDVDDESTAPLADYDYDYESEFNETRIADPYGDEDEDTEGTDEDVEVALPEVAREAPYDSIYQSSGRNSNNSNPTQNGNNAADSIATASPSSDEEGKIQIRGRRRFLN